MSWFDDLKKKARQGANFIAEAYGVPVRVSPPKPSKNTKKQSTSTYFDKPTSKPTVNNNPSTNAYVGNKKNWYGGKSSDTFQNAFGSRLQSELEKGNKDAYNQEVTAVDEHEREYLKKYIYKKYSKDPATVTKKELDFYNGKSKSIGKKYGDLQWEDDDHNKYVKQVIYDTYKSDPKLVTKEQLDFYNGKADRVITKYDKELSEQEKKEHGEKISQTNLILNEMRKNKKKVENDKMSSLGLLTYDGNLKPDTFAKTEEFRSSLVINPSDKKNAENVVRQGIAKAKKDGKKTVTFKFEGDWVQATPEKAEELVNSRIKMAQYRITNGKFGKIAKEGMTDAAKQGFEVTDALAHGIRSGVYEASKDGDLSFSDLAKGQNWKAGANTFKDSVLQRHSRLGKKTIDGKDILVDNYKWDPNSMKTKSAGFGIDLLSGMVSPTSVGKNTILKGGKLAVKNSPKLIEQIDNVLYKELTRNPSIAGKFDTLVYDKALDQLKKNGEVDFKSLVGMAKNQKNKADSLAMNKSIDRVNQLFNQTPVQGNHNLRFLGQNVLDLGNTGKALENILTSRNTKKVFNNRDVDVRGNDKFIQELFPGVQNSVDNFRNGRHILTGQKETTDELLNFSPYYSGDLLEELYPDIQKINLFGKNVPNKPKYDENFKHIFKDEVKFSLKESPHFNGKKYYKKLTEAYNAGIDDQLPKEEFDKIYKAVTDAEGEYYDKIDKLYKAGDFKAAKALEDKEPNFLRPHAKELSKLYKPLADFSRGYLNEYSRLSSEGAKSFHNIVDAYKNSKRIKWEKTDFVEQINKENEALEFVENNSKLSDALRPLLNDEKLTDFAHQLDMDGRINLTNKDHQAVFSRFKQMFDNTADNKNFTPKASDLITKNSSIAERKAARELVEGFKDVRKQQQYKKFDQSLTKKMIDNPLFRFTDKSLSKIQKTNNVDPRLVEGVKAIINERNYRKNEFGEQIDNTFKDLTPEQREHLTYVRGGYEKLNDPKLQPVLDKVNELFKKAASDEGGYEELENYIPIILKDKNKSLFKTRESEKTDFNTFNNYAMKRTFKDLFQADAAGKKVNKDLGQLTFKRMIDSQNVVAKKQIKEFAEANGIPTTGDNLRYLNEIFSPKKDEDLPLALRGLKTANNRWKNVLMNNILFPAPAMRNLMGGAVNNFQQGVGIKDYWRAFGMGDARGKVKFSDGTTLNGAELSDLAKRQGIEQKGQFTADFASPEEEWNRGFGKQNFLGSLSNIIKNQSYLKPGQTLNSNIESFLRNARFMKGLDDYGTSVKGQRMAGSDVDKTHFNYNAQETLTPFEQNIKDYVLPFYTFRRNNIPFQLEQMVMNPARSKSLRLAEANLDEENPEDKEGRPSTMNNTVKIGDRYFSTAFNPQNDVTDLNHESIMGMLSPFLKAPYEALSSTEKAIGTGFDLTGKSTLNLIPKDKQKAFVKSDIGKSMGAEISKKGDLLINGKLTNAIANLFPDIKRTNDVAKQLNDDETTKGQMALHFAGGISNYKGDIFESIKAGQQIQNLERSNKEIETLIKAGILPESARFDKDRDFKEREKKTNWESEQEKVIKEYSKTLKFLEKADAKAGKDIDFFNRFGTKYDQFGNLLDYNPAKDKFKDADMDALMKQMAEGRKNSPLDAERYKKLKEMQRTGKLNLENAYKLFGVPYPKR